jgi:hypothetical protein
MLFFNNSQSYGAYKKNTFHATVSSQQRLLIILKKEYFRNIDVLIAKDTIQVYKQIPYHVIIFYIATAILLQILSSKWMPDTIIL